MYAYDNSGWQSFCAVQSPSDWATFANDFNTNPVNAMTARFTMSTVDLYWYQTMPALQVAEFVAGCNGAASNTMDFSGVNITTGMSKKTVVHVDFIMIGAPPFQMFVPASFWVEHVR